MTTSAIHGVVPDFRASWMEQAACLAEEAETWFPATTDNRSQQHAVAVCATCPVRRLCLDYAMACEARFGESSRWGIYGGLTPKQRADRAERAAKRRTR